MTLDDIRAALSAPTETLPVDALRGAVRQADVLAPEIYAVADKFCGGRFLLPRDANLLFFGLHALAAARHADLYPCLLDLIRVDDDLDLLFHDHASTSLAQLMLSVWDGDADALFHKLEHADLSETGRWALFDVVSKLTFDGQIPRDRTEAFLTRFEAERLAESDAIVWGAWEGAVSRLGFVTLEPALRRLWAARPDEYRHPQDAQEQLDRLHRAALDPADPAPFIGDDIVAIDDPVAALSWLTRQWEIRAQLDRERAGRLATSATTGLSTRSGLTPDELDWLGGLALSRHAGPEALGPEELDGFLTAIVIGPPGVALAEMLSVMFDIEQSGGIDWHGSEQEAYAKALIEKQFSAIAAQRDRRRPIEPLGIEPYVAKDVRGLLWANGFELAVMTREAAWEPIFAHERTAEPVWTVLDLGPPVEGEAPIDVGLRGEILAELPNLLRSIADFWKDPAAALAKLKPVRTTKVGRNDPCPCGSGKKYKKCCAAGSSDVT